MNSDNPNQNSPEIIHSIPAKASEQEAKLFPLPKQEPTPFETHRALIGLFKQGPLETQKEFAQRIVKAFQEYEAKKAAKQKSE